MPGTLQAGAGLSKPKRRQPPKRATGTSKRDRFSCTVAPWAFSSTPTTRRPPRGRTSCAPAVLATWAAAGPGTTMKRGDVATRARSPRRRRWWPRRSTVASWPASIAFWRSRSFERSRPRAFFGSFARSARRAARTTGNAHNAPCASCRSCILERFRSFARRAFRSGFCASHESSGRASHNDRRVSSGNARPSSLCRCGSVTPAARGLRKSPSLDSTPSKKEPP